MDIGWAGRRVDSRHFLVVNIYCIMIGVTIWLRGDHIIGFAASTFHIFFSFNDFEYLHVFA